MTSTWLDSDQQMRYNDHCLGSRAQRFPLIITRYLNGKSAETRVIWISHCGGIKNTTRTLRAPFSLVVHQHCSRGILFGPELGGSGLFRNARILLQARRNMPEPIDSEISPALPSPSQPLNCLPKIHLNVVHGPHFLYFQVTLFKKIFKIKLYWYRLEPG
jgi:hypothetical protein